MTGMFTCDNCQQRKPDNDRVRINRFLSFFIGLASTAGVSQVCRDCAWRVRRVGLATVLGLLVIGLMTLWILNFAGRLL